MAEKKPTGTALVAGAGISGIKAAIELAESGYKVLLTNDSPQIGGILAKLDYQFPTDHCRRELVIKFGKDATHLGGIIGQDNFIA